MHAQPCRALIFDLDGVLIDSNALYEQHWEIWAERNGVSFSDIAAVHHGRPISATIRAVAPHLNVPAQARAYKAGLEHTKSLDRVQIFPGVLALLDALPPASWAIATSAPRRFAMRLMRHLALPTPRVFITGDDVSVGKPHPLPYLSAAASLGISPSECVVVEDAPAGVASARAAGAFVLGVLTTNTAAALAQAHATVNAIRDITVRRSEHALLVSWVAANR